MDVHVQHGDMAAVTRVAWDIGGQFSRERGSWSGDERQAHEQFRGAALDGRPDASTVQDAVAVFRRAMGRRGILV